MNELIRREIDEIRKDIRKISDLSEEYLFSLVCFKYFYNDGYLSYKDYREIFVDGKNDDIIDILTKIDQTISNFKMNVTSSYNEKLRKNLKDKLSYI